MQNMENVVVQLFPDINKGNMTVTYIHTNARKIVFPIAIFFKCRNPDMGIFGAEYKKVAKMAIPTGNQCSLNGTKKITEDMNPAMNSPSKILRCFSVH